MGLTTVAIVLTGNMKADEASKPISVVFIGFAFVFIVFGALRYFTNLHIMAAGKYTAAQYVVWAASLLLLAVFITLMVLLITFGA